MGKLQLADVENEYQKFPELQREDVQKIREWMEKQPHLPKISDLEIILFLHSNYHRIEPTKKTIDENYTCRTHVPEFFANLDITGTEMKTAFDIVTIVPLSIPTKDQYTVLYAKLLTSDATNFSFESCLKFLLMIADVIQRESGAVHGYTFVLDMEGVTMGHVARLAIGTIRKFLHFLQEAMPVRLKGIHLTNVVPFIDKILMLIKPFMKKELLEILHLHSKAETLYPFVQKECLITELGGNAGSLMEIRKTFNQHMVNNRDFLIQMEKVKADEKLEAILFLHSNFYKMEATKTAIEAYYTIRSTVPMFFSKRSAKESGTKQAMDTLYGTILPKPTKENHVVVYGALKDFDTANFDIGEIFKLMIGVTDVQFLENGASDGYRIVIDMKGVTFGHVGKLSVAALKNFLLYLQDAMPIRLKGLHFASVPSFMDIVLGLLKPFMKKELMGMLYLHPTYEHMYPYFGKECLPSDCGGESESREELTEKCFGHIKELHEYFVEEEQTRRVDESKRVASPKAGGGLSGVMGSFRKLDID